MRRIAIKKTHAAEKFIADWLIAKMDASKPIAHIDVDKYVAELKESNPTITDEQIKLFYNFAKYNVNFLVGYAGCGKSWVTKMLLDMLTGMNILLLAPTGKAAKVIEGYCGIPASTIHRAIGVFDSGDDDEDAEAKNESYADVVVVDESSMSDIPLVAKLLKALKNPNVRILFIGDDFQLPSVGAGNFLHDCKTSGKFAVTQLTKVFRQAEGGILDVATNIRENKKFMEDSFPLNLPIPSDDNIAKAGRLAEKLELQLDNAKKAGNPTSELITAYEDALSKYTYMQQMKKGNDMLIHPCSSEYMLDGVLMYYEQALDTYTKDEILVLSPTKIGNLGTGTLNKKIQELVNPHSPNTKQVKWGKDDETAVFFRVGDRVINVQNNYKAVNIFNQEVTVYNGEMGEIKDIDLDTGDVIIAYDTLKDGEVKTPKTSLATVVHAYALTIHKSQGSGFKCVIMATDKGNTFMLNANLIYTGITRTKEMIYWLCQPNTINHSMNKNIPDVRNTFLKDMLVQA